MSYISVLTLISSYYNSRVAQKRKAKSKLYNKRTFYGNFHCYTLFNSAQYPLSFLSNSAQVSKCLSSHVFWSNLFHSLPPLPLSPTTVRPPTPTRSPTITKALEIHSTSRRWERHQQPIVPSPIDSHHWYYSSFIVCLKNGRGPLCASWGFLPLHVVVVPLAPYP